VTIETLGGAPRDRYCERPRGGRRASREPVRLPGDHDLAELVYEVDGDRLILVHTGVPESLGGRGVGSRLVRASIARAAHDGLTIVPWCPFARGWLREHPDAAQGVRVDFKTPPPAA
jgi:predicted GNAT family acetyltransferase